MAKTEKTVKELVDNIKSGRIALPEMQRRYVWRSTRVRDLLDSLYRGYPSGSILLWETDEDVSTQEFAVSQEQSPFATKLLLLDGQQRLTSLASVIEGSPIQTRNYKRPIEILFNLEHPEAPSFITEVNEDGDDDTDADIDVEHDIEDAIDSDVDELQARFNNMTFVVSTKKLAQLPHWVKVSDVFKEKITAAQILKSIGVNNFDDPRFEKYHDRIARLKAIKEYVYKIDILDKSMKYPEVTEIFVRVNSLGAKLRSADLALAQITAKWKNSLKTFMDYQEQCHQANFNLDLSIFLRTLMACATGQAKFHLIKNLSQTALQIHWNETCRGIDYALNFLKNNVQIDSPALLSSPFLIVTLAYFAHTKAYNFTEKESALLKYWILITNAKGRYSRGSSETILDQDLAIIREGLGLDELLNRLMNQVGGLDIKSGELEGRNQRSALFKTMFLVFRANEAKDWKTQLTIALNAMGQQHSLQFHHIFPQKVLREANYPQREIDDIANLCFIGGKTNKIIPDKAPIDYFPNILAQSGQQAFDAQCIPTSPQFLDVPNYKDFLKERRKLIVESLNRHILQSKNNYS